MNKTSFEVSVYSHCLELLEDVRRVSCLDTEIIQDGDMLKVCILSVNTTDYVTDDIIFLITDTIQRLRGQFPKRIGGIIGFRLDIEIVVTDADESSIPGILFPAEYIELASELEIQTRFHLLINSSTREGNINSGAYFYIESENDIDVPVLNRIAGTQPSIIYQKGCKGRSTILSFNAWGIEESSDNQLPDVPAIQLMRKLQKAKEIGLFCKKNNIDSHVDITCYSIPSKPLSFQLEPSFFTFLKELCVHYIDMDFMN